MEYTEDVRRVQSKILAQLLSEHEHSDVVFVVGKGQTEFKAHRIFLAAVSPVWKAMLYGNMKESEPGSQVVIDDIDADAFQSVLNYAYHNNPKITTSNVLSVRFICDKYQITALSAFCDAFFSQCLNPRNLCGLLNDAVRLKSDAIAQQCLQCLQQNVDQSHNILQCDAFLNLTVKTMQLLLKSDHLKITEEDLWQMVVKWADHQSLKVSAKQADAVDDGENDDEKNSAVNLQQKEYRQYLLKSVRFCMRFGLMDGKYFATKVVPENILTPLELTAVLLYFQDPKTGCGAFSISRRQIVSASKLKMLSYSLKMSTKHSSPPNSAEALMSCNVNEGCGTLNVPQSFIEIRFGEKMQITKIEIAGPGSNMRGGWSVGYLNGRKLQYKDDEENWIDILTLDNLEQNVIHEFQISVAASSLRVYFDAYVAIGSWRVYGSDNV